MASLRNYLRRDGWLLGLSLLLGALVWKYANDELTETQPVTVRLELAAPEGLTLVGRVPESVRLVLRGTRRGLAALDAAALVVRYADLPAKAGAVRVSLTEKNFALPEGVQIVDLPRPFEVVLDHLEGKLFAVRPAIAGRVAAGLVLLRAAAEPAEILATARKERLEELARQGVDYLETEPVDVSGKAKSFTAYARLLPPRDVQVVEPVKVWVEIGVEPVNREIPGVEVRLLQSAGLDLRLRLETPLLALPLRGDPRVLANLSRDPKDLLVMADVSGLAKSKPGVYDVPVRLQLPPGVALAPGAAVPKVQVQVLER